MADTTKKTNNATKETRRCTVRLPRLAGQNALQQDWFACNGRPCVVERGKTIEIREEIGEIIRNNEQAEEYALEYIDNLKKNTPEEEKALNM